MEEDALTVGVSLVLASDGHQHIKRVFVAFVKVVLYGVVEVKGETGTALVAVC